MKVIQINNMKELEELIQLDLITQLKLDLR